MRNIILALTAIIAVILIALSFQNNTQTVSNSVKQSVKREKKEPKKDIEVVYINKNSNQNNQNKEKSVKKEYETNTYSEKEEDINLPPEQQKLASMIKSNQYIPADDRVYQSEDGEYEAKVYIPKPQTTKEAELLPPSIPRMINIFTPSGSVMPIVLTKRVKNHHIIVKFKDKDSGNVEYKKVDTDSNANNDETQSTPPLPPAIK